MLTEQQIEDQQEFERKCISGGIEKLRSNTTKLEDKTYASATVYGSAFVNSILPKLIAYIDEKKFRALKQGGSGFGKYFHNYLLPVDSDLQALLTCKVTFDHVFSSLEKKRWVTPMVLAIGAAMEGECQMRYYETECPALLATLKKNYWHEAKGTNSKRVCIQTLMHKTNRLFNGSFWLV
jgi:hypothetical protein